MQTLALYNLKGGVGKSAAAVNLAYLAAADKQIATRKWQFVMDEMVKLKKNETHRRWQTAIGQGVRLDPPVALAGNAPGTFPARVGGWQSLDQRLSAAHPQLRLGHDLVAVAGVAQETLASRGV